MAQKVAEIKPTWPHAALSGIPHRVAWHTQDASPSSGPEEWHATVLCKPHTLAHTHTHTLSGKPDPAWMDARTTQPV